MSKNHALIFDQALGNWLEFSDSVESLCANSLDEVIPAMRRIEAAAADGLTAIGYVSYEAASAFDSSLRTAAPNQPLLEFGLFADGRPTTLPMLSENAFTALSINMGETHYLKQLARIKQHLEAGDCYQVNFTHQLSAAFSDPGLSPLQLFALLTQRQPSPHAV